MQPVRVLRGAVAIAVIIVAAPAPAQDVNATRSLAATCTTCHGSDGNSIGGLPPALAGKNKDYLLQMLMDYKAGKRPATVMHQLARGYTDEQLERIATWFAAAKPVAAAGAPRAGN